MGVYVYTLRTKSITANNCKIHAFKYLCRAGDLEDPWTGFSKRTHLLQVNLQRTEDRWTPENMPEYFTIEDPSIGTAVYKTNENFQPVWYDTDELRGKIVGYLIKQGRKWIIQTPTITKELERKIFKQAVELNLIEITEIMTRSDTEFNSFIKNRLGYTYLNFKDEFVQEYRNIKNKTQLINS